MKDFLLSLFASPRWLLAYALAAFWDLADYFAWIIFGLPVVGDFFDVLALVTMGPLIGKYALLDAVEFIPIAGDLVPSCLIATYMAQRQVLGSPYDLKGWK